ncbi:hypothetical protein [Flavimarina sp. Hel_I_48]|uniref:hypothetical protein n=1 Tax=Flavimarina sp. Hel_I_48 TaxID=1392488 RepID=UPI0004DF319F|nr:hypothetical protein [Flavimarina sp. Hel_I_48]
MTSFTKRAIVGGILFLLVIGAGSFITGHLSGYEAKQLIKVSITGLNTLCNTIVLASASILALLLTVLGLSSNSSSTLREGHYINIMQIAKFDTSVFVSSLICFVLFNFPVTESDNIPADWYDIIYYLTLIISSILSAALIVVVLMLYGTVSSIIKLVGLGKEDHLVAEEEIKKTEEEHNEE